MYVKQNFGAVGLACLLLSFWAAVAWGAQPIVANIEIRGLQRIEEGVVRKQISQQTGQPLSQKKISRDIRNIYSTGYFRDVKVEGLPFEGGIKLIYVVTEKPTISLVTIYGNKEIKTADIRKQISIATGSVADTVLINDNAVKIKAYYESEGFSLTQVVPVLKALGGNRADLTY
nr:hypothetical protein [Nitrospiraceae bacterium]